VIQGFAFEPADFSVSPGEVVKVVNHDGVTHTLTSTSRDGHFDSGDIPPGGSATFTAPRKPGRYAYDCTLHIFMKGVLTVT
jgi:plastocyanin